MEQRFKKGDRVRVIKKLWWCSRTGKIVRVWSLENRAVYDVVLDDDSEYSFFDSSLDSAATCRMEARKA